MKLKHRVFVIIEKKNLLLIKSNTFTTDYILKSVNHFNLELAFQVTNSECIKPALVNLWRNRSIYRRFAPMHRIISVIGVVNTLMNILYLCIGFKQIQVET